MEGGEQGVMRPEKPERKTANREARKEKTCMLIIRHGRKKL
jgi:hypothetical protein